MAIEQLQPLRHLVDSFVATASDSSLADVRALQKAPHGSLAYGATGVVSVLLHHAARGGGPVALRAATRWMSQVAASRAPSLLGTPDTGDFYNETSLWFGAPGIRYVRILGALAGSERASVSRAIRMFVEHAAAALKPEQAEDLILGVAGNLIAVNLLRAIVRGNPALEQVAQRLAERVAATIWAHEDNWSFAHGWPGMAFALLQEAQVSGRPVPDELVERLRHFASREAVLRPGFDLAMRASWCNGAAGQILLWVKAFELTRHPQFLDRACADARLLPGHADRVNHMLCCGTAGWAYAFLALERVNPDHGWYDRAVRTCVESVEAGPAFEHASGLLKGYSGLLYLAIDLLQYTPSCGFPFVEAIPAGRHRS